MMQNILVVHCVEILLLCFLSVSLEKADRETGNKLKLDTFVFM